MAKFRCVCGEVISTSGEIPNPCEWRSLSDIAFDSYSGHVDVEALDRATTIMFRCPRSGHLWFFWDGIDAPPSVYSPTQLPAGWVDFEKGP